MFLNRLSSNRQVSVPTVLDTLGLQAGDAIIFTVDPYGEVTLGRADDPFINPTASFIEWADEHDRIYDQLCDP